MEYQKHQNSEARKLNKEFSYFYCSWHPSFIIRASSIAEPWWTRMSSSKVMLSKHKIQSPKNHEKQKIKKSTSPCSEPNNQKTSSLNKKKSNQNHLFRHAISLPCLCLNLEPMTFTESEAGIERKVVGEDIIPVSKWLINPINDLLNGCHSSRFQVLL